MERTYLCVGDHDQKFFDIFNYNIGRFLLNRLSENSVIRECKYVGNVDRIYKRVNVT